MQTLSSAAEKAAKSELAAFVILRAPDWPLARTATVSFVEVSPSTVIELKVRPTAAFSARESSAGGIAASVAMNASIVAMFGSIMPEPFAQPRRRTCLPPTRSFVAAHFGRVSVVMMARANSLNVATCALRARTRSGTASRILSTRSGAPITPVEQTRICEGSTPPSSSASFCVIAIDAG